MVASQVVDSTKSVVWRCYQRRYWYQLVVKPDRTFLALLFHDRSLWKKLLVQFSFQSTIAYRFSDDLTEMRFFLGLDWLNVQISRWLDHVSISQRRLRVCWHQYKKCSLEVLPTEVLVPKSTTNSNSIIIVHYRISRADKPLRIDFENGNVDPVLVPRSSDIEMRKKRFIDQDIHPMFFIRIANTRIHSVEWYIFNSW